MWKATLIGLCAVAAHALMWLGAGPVGADEQAPVGARVTMTNELEFEPAHVTITEGEAIVWENTSDVAHTVTADEEFARDADHVRLPRGADSFNSGSIEPDRHYRRQFPVAGEYTYFCIPHEGAGMIGRITVEPAR